MQYLVEALVESHVDLIYDYEVKKLHKCGVDESEIMLASWSSRWRKEQIQFYIQAGWSYVIFHNNNVVGYFLAQPLMFFEGLTQSLWIDQINFDSSEIAHELVLTAWRLCRDKNFQRLYLPQQNLEKIDLSAYSLKSWHNHISFINHPKLAL